MLISTLHKLVVIGAAATITILGSGPSAAQTPAPSKKFTMDTLQQVSVGELPPGKWDMKATMLVIERFTSAQLYFRPDRSLANPQRCNLDSS